MIPQSKTSMGLDREFKFTSTVLSPRVLCSLFFTLLFLEGSCQIVFEPGYFVGNDGQRVNVLIRNEKWKNNPSSVLFKREGSERVETGTVVEWKEFGVTEGETYRRGTVALDRSSNQLSELDAQRAPSFVSATLFLQELVTGRVSLYRYEENKFQRFFLKLEGDTLIPLVYKVYRATEASIGRNELFKGQLKAALSCPHTNDSNWKDVKYEGNALITMVSHFNACQGGPGSVGQQSTMRHSKLFAHLRGGVSQQSFEVNQANNSFYDKTMTATSLQVGLEGELHLPSRGDRWGIAFGALYQKFTSEVPVTSSYNMSVLYQTVDITVGPRYFFQINDRSRVFLNAGVAYSFTFNSELNLNTNTNYKLDLFRLPYYWIGVGYQLSRLGVELRYITPRDPLNKYAAFSATLVGTPYLTLSYRVN